MTDAPVLLPPTPAAAPQKRYWGFWATVGLGAAVLLVFFVVQLLVILVAGIALSMPELDQSLNTQDIVDRVMDALNARLGLLQSIATIASGILGTGLILLFIRARRRADVQEYLGVNSLSLKSILVSVVTVIGLIAVFDGLAWWLGYSSGGGIVADVYNTSIWPPLFWIAVVVFAPLFEEAFFRGFLFAGFRQSPLGAAGAVALTALAWALMHALQYSLFSIGWIFVLGVAIGTVRHKTGSIWSAFIMHALVNFIATLSLAMNWNI
ncbi:MAG: type II CAAX endopeptidase family protein [Dehalococcoidales bacterium]|jgi:hypothetical protein